MNSAAAQIFGIVVWCALAVYFVGKGWKILGYAMLIMQALFIANWAIQKYGKK